MFYEPGKTDHGLPRDPFKVRQFPYPLGAANILAA